MNSSQTYQPGKCPACGRPDGAVMHSSRWGHPHLCCNEQCGMKVAEIIRVNTSTRVYKEAVRMLERQQQLVEKLRNTGLKIQP